MVGYLRVLEQFIELIDHYDGRVYIVGVVFIFAFYDMGHYDWGRQEDVCDFPGCVVYYILETDIKLLFFTELSLPLCFVWSDKFYNRSFHL
jgi:hypothetical protein